MSIASLTLQADATRSVTFRLYDVDNKSYGPFTVNLTTTAQTIRTVVTANTLQSTGGLEALPINWSRMNAFVPSAVAGTVKYNWSDGAENPNSVSTGTLIATTAVRNPFDSAASAATVVFRSSLGSSFPNGFVPLTNSRFTYLNADATGNYYGAIVERQVVQTMDPVVCLTWHGFYGPSAAGETPKPDPFTWLGAEAKIIDSAGADVTGWKTVKYGSVRAYIQGACSAASSAGTTGNVVINPGAFEHFYVDFGVQPVAGQKLLIRYMVQRTAGSLYYSREAWSTREGWYRNAAIATLGTISVGTGYIFQEPIVSGVPMAGTSKRIAVFGTSFDQNVYRWDSGGPHLWNWHGKAWGAAHNLLLVANNGSKPILDIASGTSKFDLMRARLDMARDCDLWVYGNPFTNELNTISSAGTRTSVVAALLTEIDLWANMAAQYNIPFLIGNAFPVSITSTDDFQTLANQTIGSAHQAGGVTDLNTALDAAYGGRIMDFYTACVDIATGKLKIPTTIYSSTATAGVTVTSLVDSVNLTASLPQEVYRNYLVKYTSGAAAGLAKKASTSNTTTVTHATFGATVPVAGDAYSMLAPFGIDTVTHPGPGAIDAMAVVAGTKL